MHCDRRSGHATAHRHTSCDRSGLRNIAKSASLRLLRIQAMRIFSCLMFVTALAIARGDQRATLGELVVQQQTPFTKLVSIEDAVVRTLMSLSSDAALIVRGIVRPMRTYLSSDGMQIYTDFELTPTSFVAGSSRTQAAPG